jgi:hypothetical protein
MKNKVRKEKLNIQNIPKPYSYKKKCYLFFSNKYIIFYEDTQIREVVGEDYFEEIIKEWVFLLNAAFREGWLKGSIYGID